MAMDSHVTATEELHSQEIKKKKTSFHYSYTITDNTFLYTVGDTTTDKGTKN
jgi:hypothetical protein